MRHMYDAQQDLDTTMNLEYSIWTLNIAALSSKVECGGQEKAAAAAAIARTYPKATWLAKATSWPLSPSCDAARRHMTTTAQSPVVVWYPLGATSRTHSGASHQGSTAM